MQKQSYGWYMQQIGFSSALHDTISLNSIRNGTKKIDHIESLWIPTNLITQAGQLAFGLGYNSDHQVMHVDINAIVILQATYGQSQTRKNRKLKSENNKK